jgi:hypothetical protein
MSARHGKIKIDGILEINRKKYIALSFIQGRSACWVKKPFLAEYNEAACWIDELKPAFGDRAFFFEEEGSALMGQDNSNGESDTLPCANQQFFYPEHRFDCINHSA